MSLKPKKINGKWFVVDDLDRKVYSYPYDTYDECMDRIKREESRRTLSNYEKIILRDVYGKNREGLLVNQWFVIAPIQNNWTIYVQKTKKPAVNIKFEYVEDAIAFAKKLTNCYGDYLFAYFSDPPLDPVSIAKWTVEDGLEINALVEAFDGKTIKKNQLSAPETKQLIKQGVEWWSRNMEWK